VGEQICGGRKGCVAVYVHDVDRDGDRDEHRDEDRDENHEHRDR